MTAPTSTVPAVRPPDFKNMRYPAKSCGDDAAFTLRNGTIPVRDPNDYPQTYFDSAVPVDLDGTGNLEYVVILYCRFAMTDHSSQATVWAARNGMYEPLAVVPVVGTQPDSATGGAYRAYVLRVTAAGRVLTETQVSYEPNDANCCPSDFIRASFSLNGDKFVPVGTPKMLASAVPPRTASNTDPTAACGDNTDYVCPNYPYASVLTGLAKRFDVSAIATPDALKTLTALNVIGATFKVTQCTGTITRATCRVEITKPHHASVTLSMTGAPADDRRNSEDVLDANWKPVTGKVPFIVVAASVA